MLIISLRVLLRLEPLATDPLLLWTDFPIYVCVRVRVRVCRYVFGIYRVIFCRSYFKCQRSDCIAKKKVEWSVAEPGNLRIVYEAEHNHLSPQETSSATATTATTNPYDLLTQVLGDHQTSSSSSKRRHDN